VSDKARIRIAATITALFLAAISTLGVATHRHAPTTAAAPAASTAQATGQSASRRGEEEPYAAEQGRENE
jgi:hypothetical protein